MSDSFPYADIVILALIAGFVLLRLRSVLGQKIGHDTPGYDEAKRVQRDDPPVVKVATDRAKPPREEKDVDEEVLKAIAGPAAKEAIVAIKTADSSFSLRHFMEGARAAFEMVFDAFNKGDRDTLTMLLAPALSGVFVEEMDKRKGAGTKSETTLVAITAQEILSATLQKSIARIRLRFVSEQVTVVRDKTGAIVEGNPSQGDHVEDEWTFERDLTARNPNWKIVET